MPCEADISPNTLIFARKREGHGRPGRMKTDPIARAMPIRTTERTDSHRRDACAPFFTAAIPTLFGGRPDTRSPIQ